jgi:ABC-2 type transport system permease protein
MNLRACITIAGKDLRQQARSGTLLLFALVLPLGLAFLFNALTPTTGGGLSAHYAVADEDGGPVAAGFVDGVLAVVAEQGTFEITVVNSAEEATRLVDDGDAHAAFLIPPGFSADVQSGRTATLRVRGNVDAPVATQVARELAESYATSLRGVQLAVALTAAAGSVDDPAALAGRAAAHPPALTLTAADAAHRELDTPTYYAAGMAVFFLFFVAMLSVSSILEERSGRTMARLMAAPASRVAILAGKLLAGVGVGIAAMAVLVVTSSLLFGADWGHPVGVAVLVVAVVLAAVGLMALVATFARTSEQATNWMSVLVVLMGLFGGSFVPLAQLGTLATVSYATPHRWFLQGLSDLAGGDPAVVLAPAAALTCFAAGALALTVLRVGKVVTP